MDLSTSCRLCLKQFKTTRVLRNIHGSRNDFRRFAETFEFCIGHKTTEQYGGFICKTCDSQLIEFYKFKAMVLESRAKIEKALFKPIIHEDLLINDVLAVDSITPLPTLTGPILAQDDDESQLAVNRSIMCPVCGDHVDNLKDHIKLHESYKHCDKCHTIVKTKSFQRHYKSHDERCKECDREYSIEMMPIHRLRHKDPLLYTTEEKKQFKDHYCQDHNIFVIDMPAHLKLKHLPRGTLCCEYCGKSFDTNVKLCTHLRAEHKERFKCDICFKLFINRNRIKIHMETVHLKLQKYICPHCSKGYGLKQHLKDHIRDIHDAPAFQCTHCSKSFSNKPRLRLHVMNIHQQVKNHICDVCNAGYGDKSALLYHQSVAHSSEAKEYRKCACGVEVYSAKAMRNHLDDEHVKADGRFHCSCGKSFGARCRLVTHLIARHSMTPMREVSNKFKCSICEVGYSSSYALKYHYKNTDCGKASLSTVTGPRRQR